MCSIFHIDPQDIIKGIKLEGFFFKNSKQSLDIIKSKQKYLIYLILIT
jgi:hypothetical protein